MTSLQRKVRQADEALHTSDPFPIVTIVPNPGERYGLNKRILATLTKMSPGSDDSFLVDYQQTAFNVAKKHGFQICTRPEDKKHRVWRLK